MADMIDRRRSKAKGDGSADAGNPELPLGQPEAKSRGKHGWLEERSSRKQMIGKEDEAEESRENLRHPGKKTAQTFGQRSRIHKKLSSEGDGYGT